MALQNILMIGPREAFAEIVANPGLQCKLVVIDDGFKALLGFVKLGVKATPLAGIYVHQATGRVELPMYFKVLRSIELGMARPKTPIWVGVRNPDEFEHMATSKDLVFVDLPDGDTKKQVIDALIIQLNAFAASVAESI
jgi:hypothetical protein